MSTGRATRRCASGRPSCRRRRDRRNAVSAVLQWRIENSTDATRGQPLAARVLARKAELEDALADCSSHDVLRRTALETALVTVYQLMTGDLAHPSDVIAH